MSVINMIKKLKKKKTSKFAKTGKFVLGAGPLYKPQGYLKVYNISTKTLTNKKYKIIYCDPPWKYGDVNTGGNFKSGSANHYLTMTVAEIEDVLLTVKKADNCVLFMWSTFPMIPDALEIMKHSGFKFKTVAFTWVKKTVNGKDVFGMGRWTRGNPEICLLGIIGKPKAIDHSIPNLTYAEVGRHSQKPKIFYEKIEKLCGKLP
ncbi:MAG TPA: hypothetical protein HA319_05040, partial [Nitrosopumilaceae archaeon]|nr:hypothetical protein [Nitrosopumilaceae archaeon]